MKLDTHYVFQKNKLKQKNKQTNQLEQIQKHLKAKV